MKKATGSTAVSYIDQSSIVGCIDHCNQFEVSGWVFNRSNPSESIEVALCIDGTVVGAIKAKRSRPDVSMAHDCTQYCGFRFVFDVNNFSKDTAKISILAGEDHRIALPFTGSDEALRSITISVPPDLANLSALRVKLREHFAGNVQALLGLNRDPDIRLAGLDPAIANIYIINGAAGMASEYFRTYSLAKALSELGYSPMIFGVNDVPYLGVENIFATIFVRVAMDDAVASYVSRLRSKGVPVISDFDDLVFRPSLIDQIDGVRYLTLQEKEAYRNGMMMYREQIINSDAVWVTTSHLAKEVAVYNPAARKIANFPLASARSAVRNRREKQPSFTIGYYSGTLTHQADFRVCANAMATVLQSSDNVTLRIVGNFDVSEFEAVVATGKLETRPFMSYSAMIEDMSECDVVIAPLEIGDPFCESKSELKFFDAALVGVPLIASATLTYKEVIQNGVNGFVVEDHREWVSALSKLISNREMAAKIGQAAYDTVLDKFSDESYKAVVRDALADVGIGSATPKYLSEDQGTQRTVVSRKKQKGKRLAVLFPDIFKGSGGHRKALTWCRQYVLEGGDVEVIFMSNKSDEELESIVSTYYFKSCGRIRAYRDVAPMADVVVATSWPTAYEIAKWQNKEKFYFIQDFEPLFSPMSGEYALAYNSYRLGLTPIAFGDWNAKMLEREFDIKVDPIKFPVDREVYSPTSVQRSTNTILYYGRPSQPRRLYDLGLRALQLVRPHIPNVRVVFYGDDNYGALQDAFEFAGKKTDLKELADLYSSATVGLAFSTTNPSLIPFEMLACGLPVIDVDVGLKSDDFEGCEALIKCEPTVEAIARTIYRLITNEDLCASLSEKAIQWAQGLPNEVEFAQEALKKMGLAR